MKAQVRTLCQLGDGVWTRIKAGHNTVRSGSIQVTLDIYGHLMKPAYKEEAEKLRATLFSSKNSEDGSKMVAEGVDAMKKAPGFIAKCLIFLVGRAGVEPATY